MAMTATASDALRRKMREDRYRGATVLDLDPPPALSVHPHTPIQSALLSALSHDYTHLTVIHPSTRALLGYIDMPSLQARLQKGDVKESDDVGRAMRRFERKGRRYWVCTPETGLGALEGFFEGEEDDPEEGVNGGDGKEGGKGEKKDFAVVTDEQRKFVVGVVTREDLDEFVRRRPR